MNDIIRARIISYIKAGFPINQAFDVVLGAGAFSKMASEVYTALRNQTKRPA